MSQALVTNFYTSRKRVVAPKNHVSETVSTVQAEPKKAAGLKKKVNNASKSKQKLPPKNKASTLHISPAKTSNEINKELLQSPKRSLPPTSEGTPTKKKHINEGSKALKKIEPPTVPVSPLKLKETLARKRLDLDSLGHSSDDSSTSFEKKMPASPRKTLSSTPEKMEALINQSRSKLFHGQRLSELKESLARFSEKTAKFKEYESNPQKVTSVITQKSPIKLSIKPASKRFSHLAEDGASTLVLPFTYKLLAEQFHNLETVVGMLNNRKEKITFEKVCAGVEKIMKRKFTKQNLAQIVTVFPSAYTLTIEKCKSTTQKNKISGYQLVISPNLVADTKKTTGFIPMDISCLVTRRKEFNWNLLSIVKKHHQAFLRTIGFCAVPEESLKRWHVNFNVSSVPDVPSAKLPESPDTKICTAKDVLDKVKFSFPNKVETALKKVAAESSNSGVVLNLKEISKSKPETKSALKGISSDLLEKIRAKESANLLKAMTRSPTEVKRQAMLERLPKIINILWHYFVAERKAAVHVDIAVEKIIHSFSSLSNPDYVKDHLKLISEQFPGWLTFTEISKGTYITIDKKQNINDMLDNAKLK